MNKLENFLNKFLGPIANYMNNSLFFSSLSEAFMRITAITLGGAVVLLIGNFPIPAWLDFLNNTGISAHIGAAQNATMNAIALFIVFNFAYVYTKKSGYEPLSAGLLAIASFLILIPQNFTTATFEQLPSEFPAEVTVTGINQIYAFSTDYTGATGIIVAILVGWLTAVLYVFFNKKNLVIKLPASVPPNVAESLRPSILAGCILLFFVAVRMVFAFVPGLSNFGDVFSFIGVIVQAPLQNLVSSAFSLVIIFSIANVLWFFGIHPNMIYGIIMPVLMANQIANQNAYATGEEIPYLTMAIASFAVGNAFGGQGTTLGLIISMARAKSERYKQLFKLASVPSLFNINEPLVFGMPIMMNPTFFIPMLITPMGTAGIAMLVAKVLNFKEFNPMISLPWTTPGLVTSILQGGIKFFIIAISILVVSVVIWYPFFKIADNNALKEEEQAG